MVVQALVLAVLDAGQDLTFGRFGIPTRLDEDIEHNAILIHGAPKMMLYAYDPDEHLSPTARPG